MTGPAAAQAAAWFLCLCCELLFSTGYTWVT